MAITWSDLFITGTLINYTEHLWRATNQLTAEDLGIEDTDDVRKAINFGTLKLAPKESFEAITAIKSKWVTDIKYHSLAFPLLRSVRYVPDTEVKTLEKKLKEHELNFKMEVKKFIKSHPENKAKQLEIIKSALLNAAQNEQDANEAYLRVVDNYPTEDQIISKFGLEWNFFTINIPSSKQAATAAKRAAPQIQNVLSSMIQELRSELSNRVSELINLTKSIQEGNSRFSQINPKNIKATVNVLDRVNALNFLEDPVLKQQTANLRSFLQNEDLDEVLKGLTQVNESLSQDIEKAVEKAKVKIGKRKLLVD